MHIIEAIKTAQDVVGKPYWANGMWSVSVPYLDTAPRGASTTITRETYIQALESARVHKIGIVCALMEKPYIYERWEDIRRWGSDDWRLIARSLVKD